MLQVCKLGFVILGCIDILNNYCFMLQSSKCGIAKLHTFPKNLGNLQSGSEVITYNYQMCYESKWGVLTSWIFLTFHHLYIHTFCEKLLLWLLMIAWQIQSLPFLSKVGRTYVPHEVLGFGSLETFPFYFTHI